MNNQEIKKACLDLMARTEAAFLTTIGNNGYPETRAMLNLHDKKQYPALILFFETQEDFTFYCTTNADSQKMKQIKANPKSSIYFCDAKIFHGLMLGGDIEIVSDMTIKRALWHDDWTMYYPSGVDGADYTVLRMRPSVVKGWFQMNRFELDLNQ